MLRWFRKKPTDDKSRTPAERMLTLKRADVYYLPITKCGSTYLKNLFHYLDNGTEHESGPNIHHRPEALVRANTADTQKITESGYAFTVLRDPVDRFISLYFDKIYGDGPRNFADLRLSLVDEIGLELAADLDVEGHRSNCRKFISWLDDNLAFKTTEPVNPHWRRQASRVKRVEELDLVHLTLDGLDWQLPMLVGDVIPDIRDAMAAVKERNRVPRSFSRAELLDFALLEQIKNVYHRDLMLYNTASDYWKAAHEELTRPAPDKMKVIAAGDLPLYYIATPKVGCTYLKNIFYYLENQTIYTDPGAIHGSGGVPHLRISRNHKGIGFYVVRNPVERVISLYFDKIFGTGPQSFPWIAKQLAANRNFDPVADTIEGHRSNINSFLGNLEYRFENTPDDLNPHWRPQVDVEKLTEAFGFRALLLENLEEQLVQIGQNIPELREAMSAVKFRNTAERPFSVEELLTPEIASRIDNLYHADWALYERIKKEWADGAT